MDISLLGQLNMSPFHLITHSITLSESHRNWILVVAQYFAKMIWCKVSTVSCSTRNPGEDKLRITFTFILTLTFLYWVSEEYIFYLWKEKEGSLLLQIGFSFVSRISHFREKFYSAPKQNIKSLYLDVSLTQRTKHLAFYK